MRTILRLAVVALLFGTLTTAEAQRPPRPDRGDRPRHGSQERRAPWSRQASPKERRERDEIRDRIMKSMRDAVSDDAEGRKALNNFRRMAGHVARFAPIEDLRALDRMASVERIRAVVKHWGEARAEARKRQIRSLSPELQAELAKLDGPALDKRLADIRADKVLAKAIENAKRHELISLEEASGNAPDTTEAKLNYARDLNKQVFLHAYRTLLEPADLERLTKISADDFWRDPAVRAFRLSAHFSPSEINRLRRLKRKERRDFLRALRGEKGGPDLESFQVLDQEMRSLIGKLDRRQRHRLARDLERIHFRDSKRFGLPPELRRQLNPEELDQLATLSGPERRAFLTKRFPDVDWDQHDRRHESFRRIRKKLGDDWRTLVRQSFEMSPEEFRAELVRRLGAEDGKVAVEFFDRMRKHGGRRGGARSGRRGGSKEFFETIMKLEASLTAEERKAFGSMDMRKRMEFLRERFPEEMKKLQDASGRGGRKSGRGRGGRSEGHRRSGSDASPQDPSRSGSRRDGRRGKREGADAESKGKPSGPN